MRRDLELYGPLLADDGLVAFHDIVPGPRASVGGVPQFWSELRASCQVRELVRDWAQGEAGIGLVEATELEQASSASVTDGRAGRRARGRRER